MPNVPFIEDLIDALDLGKFKGDLVKIARLFYELGLTYGDIKKPIFDCWNVDLDKRKLEVTADSIVSVNILLSVLKPGKSDNLPPRKESKAQEEGHKKRKRDRKSGSSPLTLQ